MKKFISIAASMMLLGCLAANAQVNVHAGYLNTDRKATVGSTSTNINENGFIAGVGYDLPITGGLYLAPEVNLKGVFSSNTILNVTSNNTTLALSVPVYVKYGFDLASDLKLSVMAGPQFDLGLSMTSKTGSNTYNYYDNDYNRFNVGLAGAVAFDFLNRYRLQVGYSMPLTNECSISNTTVKTSGVFVTLGLLF